MENSVEELGGTEICKKTKSLDLKSFHSVRKSRVSAENKSRKRQKEVSLTSVEPGGAKKPRAGDSGEFSFGSGSNDLEKLSSLNNVSIRFSDNVVRIPKRQRGKVRRKKFEGDRFSQEDELVAKLTGDLAAKVLSSKVESERICGVENRLNLDEKLAEEAGNVGANNGVSVSNTVSSESELDKKITNKLNLGGKSEEEDGDACVNNRDSSSLGEISISRPDRHFVDDSKGKYELARSNSGGSYSGVFRRSDSALKVLSPRINFFNSLKEKDNLGKLNLDKNLKLEEGGNVAVSNGGGLASVEIKPRRRKRKSSSSRSDLQNLVKEIVEPFDDKPIKVCDDEEGIEENAARSFDNFKEKHMSSTSDVVVNNGDPDSRKIKRNHRRKNHGMKKAEALDEKSAKVNPEDNTAIIFEDLKDKNKSSNGDSASRKIRKTPRKRKNPRSSSDRSIVVKEAEPCDDLLDDDLEQNAARMLSSRFDPSCTGFSPKGKVSSTVGLSFLVSSDKDCVGFGENSGSVDSAGRKLRPRNSHKVKGVPKKRRHFYEIFSRDLDPYWVLNQKIKVFWPLDQSWYFGIVNDYDRDRKLHHVKYDDRDEEWIDLQHERFKLLLFSSEVPGNDDPRKSLRREKHSSEVKLDSSMDDDGYLGGYMDSEPIISWLARSSRRVKSSPSYGVVKKPRMLSPPREFVLPLLSGEAINQCGFPGVGASESDRNKLSSTLALLDKLINDDKSEEKPISGSTTSTACHEDRKSKSPIVYVRRKFRRRGEEVSWVPEDDYQERGGPRPETETETVDSAAPSTNDACLSLSIIPLVKAEAPEIRLFRLCFLVRPVLNYDFGKDFSLFHIMFLLRYGAVMTMWPKVHLEMLFVDNIIGLRFLLFEGCLRRAVELFFVILALFLPLCEQEKSVDLQLPVTSIRCKFSCIQSLGKQIVFAFYNFLELKKSKWLYLDDKLGRRCLITKQLPLAECTYDNIKAFQRGTSQLPSSSVHEEPCSIEGLRKRAKQGVIQMEVYKESTHLNSSQISFDEKHKTLPPFSLFYTAAPTFFRGLHLKMLMERSVSCITFRDGDSMSLLDQHEDPETFTEENCSIVANSTVNALEITLENGNLIKPSLSDQNSGPSNVGSSSERPFAPNGITIEIPAFDNVERPMDRGSQSCRQVSDLTWNMNDGIIRSPNPTAPRSTSHRNRHNSSSSSFGYVSNAWSGGRADFFRNGIGNGPKKPRTQVSYALPFGGIDHKSKHRNNHHQKGVPFKRIRRGDEKTLPEDGSRSSQKNLEMLACDANVLVTLGDKGWRESGAQVVLELVDHNEWRLVVKLLGTTKYSYKAHQFLLPGTTNRYTHVMMWRGGKDWVLEFPDRSQWALFKEMHEECHKRNLRAALVKNIPIPGVRLLEETDDGIMEVPFIRNSPKYFRQVETDADMAMDPSRVLYDMDSDDERWVSGASNSSADKFVEISEETFEKAMDMFEKVAYAQQSDHFTPEEIDEFIMEIGPTEVVKIIHEYWQQKRQIKGMPLIRHLQPPLWEKYHQLVTEWELATTRSGSTVANGCHGKVSADDKPPMFAFCLKPRGLEVPSNKGSKQRSQRRFSVNGQSNTVSGYHDGLHSLGRRHNGFPLTDEKVIYQGHMHESLENSPLLQSSRRSFSPREAVSPGYISNSSDGSERNQQPRLHRSKSKKMGAFLSHHDPQPTSILYNHRQMLKHNNNGVHRWNMDLPEWQSHKPEGSHRYAIEQLDGSDLDEFRLRDASGAAQHALNMAKLKREKAQRFLYRADLAIHKSVVALMTADAIKASFEDSIDDEEEDDDDDDSNGDG